MRFFDAKMTKIRSKYKIFIQISTKNVDFVLGTQFEAQELQPGTCYGEDNLLADATMTHYVVATTPVTIYR